MKFIKSRNGKRVSEARIIQFGPCSGRHALHLTTPLIPIGVQSGIQAQMIGLSLILTMKFKLDLMIASIYGITYGLDTLFTGTLGFSQDISPIPQIKTCPLVGVSMLP